MIDLIGHVSYAVMLAGLVLIGRGSAAGWLLRFISELAWVVIGFVIGMTSIWVWGLVFASIDYYNYSKWKNEQTP